MSGSIWNPNGWINTASAAFISFLQRGLGALERTVESKLQDTVSVFDFMSQEQIVDVRAGTKLLDTVAAIRAAIASMSKGTVYFPPGTYSVSAPVRVPDGIDLVGASRNSVRIYKSTATTLNVTLVATSVVAYGGVLPSDLNAILILDGPGGRYTGVITDLTLEGALGTPGNFETPIVEFGIVSTGSLSDYTRNNVDIVTVQYSEIYPIIFSSRLTSSRSSACLKGPVIDNGTSVIYSTNYANNCRDWGHYIRDLKYSSVTGNACDFLNDPVKYPTRTRYCRAYIWASLIGCHVTGNGDENTYGTSHYFNSFDYSTFENNVTISIGSDFVGAEQIAWLHSTNIMRGSTLQNNIAYDVKASGLISGGASAGSHHNIYFEGLTFVQGTELCNNLVRSTRFGSLAEAGWGNNVNALSLYQNPVVVKASVQFNGTTGVVIKAFNVSGIVKNGTGDYTITIADDLLDTAYAVLSGFSRTLGAGSGYGINVETFSKSVGSCRVQARYYTNTLIDLDLVDIVITHTR